MDAELDGIISVMLRDLHTPCRWTEDADGNWDTACGACLCFETDPREDTTLRFCQNCGHPLELVSYVEPVIDEEEE